MDGDVTVRRFGCGDDEKEEADEDKGVVRRLRRCDSAILDLQVSRMTQVRE